MPTDPQPTTQEPSLFRREALEHRARQRGPGEVVRVAPRWTTTAFYALIVVFVAALVAGATIEIDRFARGTAATDERGRVVILVPAAQGPDVPRGAYVQIGDDDAEVVATEDEVLYPTEVRERFGVDVVAPSVVVVTSGQASATGGVARVKIEREPVIVALVPGLKSLFGTEDA